MELKSCIPREMVDDIDKDYDDGNKDDDDDSNNDDSNDDGDDDDDELEKRKVWWRSAIVRPVYPLHHCKDTNAHRVCNVHDDDHGDDDHDHDDDHGDDPFKIR